MLGRALVRVRGAHDLVGMPGVSLVCLDPLAGLKKVGRTLLKMEMSVKAPAG